MVDYIVVGSGLAGIAICEELRKRKRSFVVFDDGSQQSSRVGGGMYNPVILKRFTPVWRAKEQLEVLPDFYSAIEKRLGVTLNTPLRLLRRFGSVEEQNNWFEAADKPLLAPFMSTNIDHRKIDGVHADHGFGEVLHAGWVYSGLLQEAYMKELDKERRLYKEAFAYDGLEWTENGVHYDGLNARHVVFCEGFGLSKNPFFNYLPLNGTKGEVLEVDIPGLEIDHILKSSAFLLPLGGSRYKVGATYKWKDKTNAPTQEAKEELLEKLERFLKLPYKVTAHLAGIRPTVADRRPLVGSHPEHANIHVFNGLGSRGVMIGPWAAPILLEHIENKQEIPAEMDAVRFQKRWFKKA